ncbi:helix-turn-helix domain-containing protein [Marinoscillum furvescens]|uniref:Helix-turn-helix protein n=1 Tax=Marinoscillum furvescens DSM 4134 TaxID=1122208 RepID=A0A3D9LHQ7_MARFU|nr:helix-turn-helix transcriptional regulator [Marinoscillum furvescens]REE05549.1 helix-turn-helix protein [Marinoscillum furvescens DSM 4134]
MHELKVEIGKRIAQIRKENGDSQLRCAEKLGIKRATLAAYEAGNNHMPDDIKNKFVVLYGLSMDYLLTGSTIAAEPPAKYESQDVLALIDRLDDTPLHREIKRKVQQLILQNIEQKEKIIELLEKYK